MAGAVIADLALEGRIDTDLDALHLVDATPTGDVLLDPTLLEIAEAQETFPTQYWIERNTVRSEEIVTTTLERLVEKGVLEYETGGFWTLSRAVSRSGTYPSADGTTRTGVPGRPQSGVRSRRPATLRPAARRAPQSVQHVATVGRPRVGAPFPLLAHPHHLVVHPPPHNAGRGHRDEPELAPVDETRQGGRHPWLGRYYSPPISLSAADTRVSPIQS